MHPYATQAKSTHKAKAGSMGKTNNLDIPVMRAVGENSGKKLYSSSSSSQQFKKQAADDGMKRGGHVGKPRHHKPAIVIAAPAGPAQPPPPDPAMAAAGAGSSPAPAPMGPMKRGGKIGIGKYPITAGADSGVGRLQLSKAQARAR
jgi:hypothetical protein